MFFIFFGRNDASRHAHRDGVGRQVLEHYGVGADHHIVSHGYLAKHFGPGADIHIIADLRCNRVIHPAESHSDPVPNDAIVTETCKTTNNDTAEMVDSKIFTQLDLTGQFDTGYDLNEFIEDFITSKRTFELKELSLDEIELDDVSTSLVDEYKEEYVNSGWYPPILYNQEDDIIVDGYHRAKMLDDLQKSYILAWV